MCQIFSKRNFLDQSTDLACGTFTLTSPVTRTSQSQCEGHSQHDRTPPCTNTFCHLIFKAVTRSTFCEGGVGWRGGRSIWHHGMPLSLRGDTARARTLERGNRCQNNKGREREGRREGERQRKETRKTKEKRPLTGAAAGNPGVVSA